MVARFQSVISAETQVQLLEKENRDYPDHVIACVGGGSNAAGLYYHFLENPRVNIIAVEAAGKGIDSGEVPPLQLWVRKVLSMVVKRC